MIRRDTSDTFRLPEKHHAEAVRRVAEHIRPGDSWPTEDDFAWLGDWEEGCAAAYRKAWEDKAEEVLELVLPVIAAALNGGDSDAA